MKFFLLIIGALILLMVLYYVTWAIHVIVPIFGKWVDPIKALIPFYGWIQWFKGPRFY
jgi:hypothetical protein